jgi:hypothetical protein
LKVPGRFDGEFGTAFATMSFRVLPEPLGPMQMARKPSTFVMEPAHWLRFL